MSTHYDEDDINEQNAENQYYDIRDTISKVRNAQAPLKLDGIAAAQSLINAKVGKVK